MPVDPQASVRISAFKWVPPFAKGHVRDLRARWALEEAGIPYAVRKLDAAAERPADYFEEQPLPLGRWVQPASCAGKASTTFCCQRHLALVGSPRKNRSHSRPLFGIPIISVTVTADGPHLCRGRYTAPQRCGLECLVTLCLCGPEAEELFCGPIPDGAEQVDYQMARTI